MLYVPASDRDKVNDARFQHPLHKHLVLSNGKLNCSDNSKFLEDWAPGECRKWGYLEVPGIFFAKGGYGEGAGRKKLFLCQSTILFKES